MDSRIRRITVDEFERYGAARHPMVLELMEELEHYAVLDGWYLGALNRDRADNDFTFVLLGPDSSGAKRWIGGRVSVASIDDARAQLLKALIELAEEGPQVHPQE
jgi:hypothetical protein